jgi:hypothetical protein
MAPGSPCLDRDQAQGINDIFIMNADGSAVPI